MTGSYSASTLLASTYHALTYPFRPWRAFVTGLGVMMLINLGITLIVFTLMDWRYFWTIFGASNGIGLGCFLTTRTTVMYFHPRFGHDIRIMLAIQPLAALTGSLLGHQFLAHTQPFIQTYATALLFGIPASLVFYVMNRISDAKVAAQKAITEREKTRKHALQVELRTLQNQIEPHFLFNTLANVSALIDLSPAQAKSLLNEYTEFLRDTMRVSTLTLWPLHDEVTMIQRYLRIQHIRFPNIRFNVQEHTADTSLHVPPLLLQPLIENAFVHGLSPKGNIGTITVTSAITNDIGATPPTGRPTGNQLVIEVRDDGVGLPEQDHKPGHHHIALGNIRARLENHYGDAASLMLANANPGVVATLTLPVHPT